MSRVTFAVPSRKRRKMVLARAKGFYGNASRNIRTAYDAVDKALTHSYVGRKQKKQQYRQLWIVRINAACRALNVNYSQFMNGLKKAGIALDRKVLAEMAYAGDANFVKLVDTAKRFISAESK